VSPLRGGILVRRGHMRRSRWLLILSFVVMSSLLAWACGGGEEKAGAPTAPAAASPGGKTPAAAETPGAGAGGEFSDLAHRFGESTFKVTYSLSGSGGTAATEGSMIWYKMGDNLRMDIAGQVAGQEASTIFIMRSDKSYLCSEAAGQGEGGSCFEMPSTAGQGVSDIVTELENTLNNPGLQVVSTSSRKIAGEDAKCYTVRSSDIEGEAELCMSGDGVPLFSKSTAQGQEMSLEATDFSHDVSESDFEPPYPVSEDTSGLPSGQ
jgi:hypothetical protein